MNPSKRLIANSAAGIKGGIAVAALLALSVSCSRERPSPIVKMVEDAGAGDLRGASLPSIRQWLEQHPEVAIEAAKRCKRIREKATAKWPDTTEGRVCEAAKQVSGFIGWRRQLRRDGRTFEGGWR
jgi:hypothetical protein